MNYGLAGFLIAATAISISGQVYGQDGSEASALRSVEGAQRFLSELYDQPGTPGNAWLWRKKDGFLKHWDDWSFEETGDYTLAGGVSGEWSEMRPIGRCRAAAALIEAKGAGPADFPDGRLEVPIDWSRLVKVETGNDASLGDWVGAEFRGKRRLHFLHPTPEEAKRVAFALDFLREHCASASDTGF